MDQLPPIQPPAKPTATPYGRRPAPAPAPQPHEIPPEDVRRRPTASSPYDRPPGRAYALTPHVRTITRYAFEFYQDQIETLRQLSLEEKALGRKGSMSEMVREALDAYIERRRTPDR